MLFRSNSGDDTLVGNKGNDVLYGGDGNDRIYGDTQTGDSEFDGDDILWGGYGDDQIYGRGGDDYLIGQNGQDTLIGGSGNDVFVITSYEEISLGADIVKDFVDGEDKIGLIGLNFDDLLITQEGNHTHIKNKDGETLLILEEVSSEFIDSSDFVLLDLDLNQESSSVAANAILNNLVDSYDVFDFEEGIINFGEDLSIDKPNPEILKSQEITDTTIIDALLLDFSNGDDFTNDLYTETL